MGVRQETQAAKACVFCFKSLSGNNLSLKSGFSSQGHLEDG